MISILSIIINLSLILAIWRLSVYCKNAEYTLHKRCDDNFIRIYRHHKDPKLDYQKLSTKIGGKVDKMYTRSVIAEKMAERAFSMASSASLGVIALQKALAVPRLLTKSQVKQNELAIKGVDRIFSEAGGFDYLRSALSEEELELLDKAEEEFKKKL